jgi:Zn-dependent peptidase ImmA (M78 family)
MDVKGWINLGDEYKPVELLVVSRDLMDLIAKEKGVYTPDDYTEGMWVHDENAIYLIDKPIHASPEFILLHEIVHCIDDLTDMHEDDENRVDAKAQLLLAFIKYNQDLIQTIIKKELYN